MQTDTKLPELPVAAGGFYVQWFRDNPAMRNVEFNEAIDFPPGVHHLYTADQLRAYGDEREAYGRATAPAEVGDGVDYTNPRMTAAQSGPSPFVTMTAAPAPRSDV